MKVLSVEIENFLSVEKAHITFDDAGLLLIEGYNYDAGRSNGAGKTALLNAISFGLYDRLPRKITATEFLRRGATSASVTVTVDCGTGTYVVKRTRPKGVMFYERQDDGTLQEVNLTQGEWESKLQLTYNQFIVSAYCAQGTSTRFLFLNDSDKKQFLLQLLNLDEFAACKKKSDEIVNQILSSRMNIEHEIRNIQGRVDILSESIIDEDTAKLELAEKQDILQQLQNAVNELEGISKPDLSKFEKLENDISVKKTKLIQARTKREMLQRQLSTLARRIKPFNADEKCPTCGADLDNSHAQSVHDAEMAKLREEQNTLNEQIQVLNGLLTNEAQINDLELKVKNRKRQELTEYESAQFKKANLSAKILTTSSLIEILNKKLIDNDSVVKRVNKLKMAQKGLQDELTELNKKLEIQKTVSSIYSPTGAQAYVLDSAVASFNEYVATYISDLWSNLTYELQSYKENVKGEVSAKFSESIVMDGRPVSLGSLSGGELRALSICVDMALLSLLEKHFGVHTSPIIFDESFDGLDDAGKEFALELIKDLAQDRQVIVIDHASEMRSAFDKVLRVEKRNGISTVNTVT